MTDLETIKAMFDRAKIVYTETRNHDGSIELRVEAHEGLNNLGYVGFSATLDFDVDGRLKAVGAWE